MKHQPNITMQDAWAQLRHDAIADPPRVSTLVITQNDNGYIALGWLGEDGQWYETIDGYCILLEPVRWWYPCPAPPAAQHVENKEDAPC